MVGYSLGGHKESDRTERLTVHIMFLPVKSLHFFRLGKKTQEEKRFKRLILHFFKKMGRKP